MHEFPPLIIPLIIAIGIAAQWLSWWLKQPAILLLLLAGLLAGPVFGILNPDQLFGSLLLPTVSLGVAVILFEGSLTLKFSEIKGLGQVVTRLVTIGALVSLVSIAWAAMALGLFDWKVALLFGALVSVTGPTVIVPILRSMRPNKSLANILRWEGIIIDPLGAVAAVVIFQFFTIGSENVSDLFLVANVFIVGIAVGAGAAFGVAFALRRHFMPDYLHNVITLAIVLLAFALSNEMAEESGLLAVTVMGIILANTKDIDTEGILNFKESLTVLLTSVLFIVLAARVPLHTIFFDGWAATLLIAFILFVARPLTVLVSTLGTSLPWPDRAVLSWVAPRGIVAASVSALFALRLANAGVAGAESLVQMVFAVIVVTVVLQGLTARPFAQMLGVADPDALGVLIVGGNAVAQAIALSLKKLNIDVIVADTSWEDIRRARMNGLQTFYGTAVSDDADHRLDLVGIGMLFALSRNEPLNSLSCMRYANEFGTANVFNIRLADTAERTTMPAGRTLFKEDVTLEKLEQLIQHEQFEIRHTNITAEFDYQQMTDQQSVESILLYAISPTGGLYPIAEDSKFRAVAGWRIAYLDKRDHQPAEKQTTDK
ncbi:MAG: cation:proton antiporter [Parvibaculaceae bacterium]